MQDKFIDDWSQGCQVYTKKILSVFFFFWKMRNFYSWIKLRAKTVTKEAECKLIKFFLIAIARSNSPLFFVRSFQWNQTTMRWGLVSTAYHFLKNLANCVDSILFFTMLKTSFQNIWKRSYRICSNFDIIDAIIASTNSLKRFLKRTLGTEKDKAN